MKNWMLICMAMALSMLAIAQTPAPTAKDPPAAALRDAPAAVDLTKKGVATGLPPAAAAKAKANAKSKTDATKGIKPGKLPTTGTAAPKEPAPAGAVAK